MALDPVSLARDLIDIDSTTGVEGDAGAWLARLLRQQGYQVVEHPVSDGRFNVFARLDASPRVVLSTHFDCVPPFFPSREERGFLLAGDRATRKAFSRRRSSRQSGCARGARRASGSSSSWARRAAAMVRVLPIAARQKVFDT